jgi:hypothetical protein
MITDTQASFCFNQAVTASAASTGSGFGGNGYIDLGPAAFGTIPYTEAFGVGEDVFVEALCTVAMTDSGSDSTVTVAIETADDSAFSTNKTTILTLGTFAALAAAKTKFVARLTYGATYRRYIRAYFTVANGDLTTGSFSVFCTNAQQFNTSYPAGYTIDK